MRKPSLSQSIEEAKVQSKVKLSMNKDLWADDDEEMKQHSVLQDAVRFNAEQLENTVGSFNLKDTITSDLLIPEKVHHIAQQSFRPQNEDLN